MYKSSQPRPQGLLVFQYGGGRREDPATAILENEKTLRTRFKSSYLQSADFHLF